MNASLRDQKPNGGGQTAATGLTAGLSSQTKHIPIGLLSRAQFAREFGVCTHTIQRMERRGLIRGIHTHPRLDCYRASELERLLKEASV